MRLYDPRKNRRTLAGWGVLAFSLGALLALGWNVYEALP